MVHTAWSAILYRLQKKVLSRDGMLRTCNTYGNIHTAAAAVLRAVLCLANKV